MAEQMRKLIRKTIYWKMFSVPIVKVVSRPTLAHCLVVRIAGFQPGVLRLILGVGTFYEFLMRLLKLHFTLFYEKIFFNTMSFGLFSRDSLLEIRLGIYSLKTFIAIFWTKKIIHSVTTWDWTVKIDFLSNSRSELSSILMNLTRL